MEDYPKYSCPFEAGEFYHIYNSAVGKERLFKTGDNYRFFLNQFHNYTNQVLSVYAYCLLGNHFHFLIKVHDYSDNKEVSEQFRRFFISYSKSFNKVHKRRGSLFNKHLQRIKIESTEQLLWTIYYIHRNPVHHRISSNYQQYRWSSYQALVTDRDTKLKRNEVIDEFSGVDEFIKFHERNIREDLLRKKIRLHESRQIRHGMSLQH